MAEIRQLRVQMASDFQSTWKLMGETADRLEEHAKETAAQLERQGRESAERFRQVEGRMRLLEQRFGKMVEAVENAVQSARADVPTQGQLAALEARVEALEQRMPPAA